MGSDRVEAKLNFVKVTLVSTKLSETKLTSVKNIMYKF